MKTIFSMLRLAVVACAMLCSVSSFATTTYFVKTNGTGNGSSWDNALSAEDFADALASTFVTGDVVCLAGGVYLSGTDSASTFTISKGITILGGFDPASTGTSAEIEYPSAFETVLSGDVNENATNDSGDIVNIITLAGSEKVVLKGLTISGAFSAEGLDKNAGGAIMAKAGAMADAELHYCTIKDNVSEIQGAGGINIFGAKVACYYTTFDNNTAASRGGALRIEKYDDGATVTPAELIVDGCLFINNKIGSDYGGAIQIAASTPAHKVYISNSTFTDNACGGKGGAAVSVSKDQEAYIVSCTFMNNVAKNASNGHSIRNASTKLKIANTISVEANADDLALFTNVKTEGNNILSKKSDGVAAVASDVEGKSSADVFAENVLADNGGYTLTIAPDSGITGTMTLADLQAKATEWNFPCDVAKDQRGYVRTAGALIPGAYQSGATTGIEDVEGNDCQLYTSVDGREIRVAGVNGKMVRIYSVQGAMMYQATATADVETINVSAYANGVYVLTADGQALKFAK